MSPRTRTKGALARPRILPPDRSRREAYLACRLRSAANPAIARSAASTIIAHWDSSVGMSVTLPPPPNGAQVGTVIVLASVVTVTPNAKALPVMFAKCPIVIPAGSRIFPTNVGAGDDALESASATAVELDPARAVARRSFSTSGRRVRAPPHRPIPVIDRSSQSWDFHYRTKVLTS